MSWKNKVVWTEGMFLRPQHFQHQDKHSEDWIETRCGPLRPFSWGFTELKIDTNLLSLGKFSIKSCRGVFPDGTPFNIPEQEPPPAALEIPSDNKEKTIYFALPIQRDTGKDIEHTSGEDGLARYRLKEYETRDSHSRVSNEEVIIETGELNTSLRFTGQDLGAYTTIPIARLIERRADSQVILEDAFIPSCMAQGASHRLSDYIKDIQGLLRHRSETLAERIGSPGAGGVAEVTDFLLLQIVNRYEPLFKHFSDLRPLHPEDLYQVLLQIAGELATITRTERRPRDFPLYLHEDLTATFPPVVDAIRESLNWIPETRAVSIPLEERKYGVRTAKVHDQDLLKTANFVLAVNANVPTEKLHRDLPRQTTITTVEKLRDLIMTQTPGIKIRTLNVAPRQIPYHAGFTYFELDKHNKLWEELSQSGAIAMHFSGEYPGLELEFWAIRG
jgi:type VI secretion system protein ImpJ